MKMKKALHFTISLIHPVKLHHFATNKKKLPGFTKMSFHTLEKNYGNNLNVNFVALHLYNIEKNKSFFYE